MCVAGCLRAFLDASDWSDLAVDNEGRPRQGSGRRSLWRPVKGADSSCRQPSRALGGSAEDPGSVDAVEAEVAQPAQVQGGGAGLQPGVVFGDAAVADFAVAAGDEPGQ